MGDVCLEEKAGELPCDEPRSSNEAMLLPLPPPIRSRTMLVLLVLHAAPLAALDADEATTTASRAHAAARRSMGRERER